MLFTSLIVQVVMIAYIGEIERNLYTRTEEHACSDKESTTYDHINNCSYYGCIENLPFQ